MIRELRDLAPDTVWREPFGGTDAYARPTYGAAVAVEHCRVTYRNRIARTESGEAVASMVTVYVLSEVSISTKDRITLPDGSVILPIEVRKIPDETGESYTEILG